MKIELIKNNAGLIITFKINGNEYDLATPVSEDDFRKTLNGGNVVLTDGSIYSFKKAGGTAQTTLTSSDINIVEIADVYLTNANTNFRLGGIGSGQWTSLEKTYVVDPAKHTIVKFSTKKYWVTGQQYYVISLNNFTSSDSLTDTRTWWNLVIVEAKVDGSLEAQISGVRIHSTNDVGYNSYQGVLENQETVANNIINFMSGTLTLDNAMRIYEEGGEDPITEFTVQNVYYQGQVQS